MTTEISKFNPKEKSAYEDSLKTYRDLNNVLHTAFDEGKIEGKIEIARSLRALGIDSEIISKSTGLSIQEIEDL